MQFFFFRFIPLALNEREEEEKTTTTRKGKMKKVHQYQHTNRYFRYKRQTPGAQGAFTFVGTVMKVKENYLNKWVTKYGFWLANNGCFVLFFADFIKLYLLLHCFSYFTSPSAGKNMSFNLFKICMQCIHIQLCLSTSLKYVGILRKEKKNAIILYTCGNFLYFTEFVRNSLR